MISEAPHATEAQFHELIHANHMYGLWELASQMTAHPTPKMIPYMWKWDLFESVLQESGEVVPIGNERRALQLFNPGLNGAWATTNSLVAAVQMLLPGESAPAHRHTPVAIRFRLRPSPCGIPCSTQRITPLPRASRPGVGRQEDTQSRPVRLYEQGSGGLTAPPPPERGIRG